MRLRLRPFAISKTAVSNGEFKHFVEDGGYRRSELWTAEGWQWRTTEVQNIRSTGSEKETVAGCGATSMNGSRWMSAYRSSMSTGTRLMLTAVGPIGVCQQKQSGRWRRVRTIGEWSGPDRAQARVIPGATILLRWNVQILIGARWDAFRLTRCRQVIVRSAAGK